MRTIGNLLWLIPLFGWLTAGLMYLIGLLFTLTVVGAPLGLGLMEQGKCLFWPFGNHMVKKADLNIEQNEAWKAYSLIVMIIYLPIGVVFWMMSVVQIIVLFFTLVGIPVALVLFKSLGSTLNPVNKKCVKAVVVEEIARRKAVEQLDSGKF